MSGSAFRLAALSIALAAALAAQAPEIAFDGNIDFLKWPAHTYPGEVAGVATTSKGNVLVYTRTGELATAGASRIFTHGGSRLFEFDSAGRYLREIGQGVYGFLFAQAVRVDAQDNIWVVDRGSDMVIKFDPSGRVVLLLGRKPESVALEGRGGRGPALVPGDNFNRPADVAFNAAGDIFVADAYTNSRIVKFDKDGRYVRSWPSKAVSLAVDAHGTLYAADPTSKRIEMFSGDGVAQGQITDVGSPAAVCISSGAHPYLFSSDSNSPDSMDRGEIYKMELDGHIVGKFGRAGKRVKEFGSVNEMDCRDPHSIYAGELTNWRVQKLTLH